MFLFGISKVFLNLMWSQNLEMFPLYISLTILFIDVGLLNWLVPVYGLVGAASATTISSTVFLVPSFFIIKKFLD
jgi:O-antigen/teichoic acid export membrane protein